MLFSLQRATGALGSASTVQSGGEVPGGLAYDNARDVVYCTNRLSNPGTLAAFTIDRAAGRLTTLGIPVSAGAPLQAVAHPSGKVFVSGTGAVSTFQVQSNQLVKASDIFVGGGGIGRAVTNSRNNLLFLPDGDSGNIVVLRISSGGDLQIASQTLAGNPPNNFTIAADSTGQFLYSADFQARTITTLRIDSANATLTSIPGASTQTADQLLSLATLGSCLYGASFSGFNLNEPRIWGYRINTDGTLTTAPGFPMRVGTLPQGVAISQSGWLFVTDFGFPGTQDPRGYLHVFSVNSSTCAVTQAAGSPYRTGLGPQSMVVIE